MSVKNWQRKFNNYNIAAKNQFALKDAEKSESDS